MAWAENNVEFHPALSASADHVLTAQQRIVDAAENGEAFDQLIAPGNEKGKLLIEQGIEKLRDFTRQVELLATALGIGVLSPDNAGHNFAS